MAVDKIIQKMADGLQKSSASTAPAATETIERASAILGTLRGIQAPIVKQATEEQRNGAWLKEKIAKAYADKYREIARLRHQNDQTRKKLEDSKPKLPEFDRTDVFAAMQTMEIAKRVAAITDPIKRAALSSMEKMAALRMPEIAGLAPSQADAWRNELLKQTEPAAMQAHEESAKALADVDAALAMVRMSFMSEAGFMNRDTGFPTPQWQQYEREQMKALESEFEAA